MGHTTMAGKRKPLGKTIGFGLLTCGCYAALFLNVDTVMQYFTRGAWYSRSACRHRTPYLLCTAGHSPATSGPPWGSRRREKRFSLGLRKENVRRSESGLA